MEISTEDLLQNKNLLHSQIVSKIRQDTETIKTYADSLIEYSTNLRGHGYSEFIEARKTFIAMLDNICNEHIKLAILFPDEFTDKRKDK